MCKAPVFICARGPRWMPAASVHGADPTAAISRLWRWRGVDLFKAGVDFHGVHNWATELGIPVTEPDYRIAFESSPMNFLRTWRSPVLLIQGDDDRDVQFNQTVMLNDALRRQKVEVEELIFPDEIHDFLLYRTWRAAYEAAVQFLDRHLKR